MEVFKTRKWKMNVIKQKAKKVLKMKLQKVNTKINVDKTKTMLVYPKHKY